MTPTTALSLVHGPTNLPLWHKTIGAVLREQAEQYGNNTAVVVPWQNIRVSFRDLQTSSEATARALLAANVQKGDMVAIMAGNRIEYIDFFLAAARVGCPLVVINNTYTPSELVTALSRTSVKFVLIARNIGSRSLSHHIEGIKSSMTAGRLPQLKHVTTLPSSFQTDYKPLDRTYRSFLDSGEQVSIDALQAAERKVKDGDLVNLQFTSGTTGLPKAAMLTHRNILNNGRFTGTRMHLTSRDIVCCPPPLFHCFGLVMGFLDTLSHGASIVFPSDSFNASLTLDAIAAEGCTALLGVPTMFLAQLTELKSKPYKINTVRVALASGAMVPIPLQERLSKEMGIGTVLIAYGMTEVSPVAWMMDVGDPEERKRGGLGKVMPHNSAKVVDPEGRILPRGSRGEMCFSGYALMKGYLNNPEGTNEAMRKDDDGVLWMHSGDECIIDDQGYAHITGRIKDMIIRGGENMFPAEIEERLLRHPAISEASVVGLPDEKYGEIVAAFLRVAEGEIKPKHAEISDWVGSHLGRQKIPSCVYWVGPGGVADDFPKTGSGKHQKHKLRAMGQDLLKKNAPLHSKQPAMARL
ncbi:hypothetical protein B0J11DRAFT_614579 [Dendryphion nanum]|uniref:Acetyl-CoA synthetase-like protein n=1 Tax=Dendryphion nanum TaxID=256645 RepID=A0A9P9DR28_9PLEO|nr:hypothetical protein B0J11DRAFT_614579 [Dendryphion nanum]